MNRKKDLKCPHCGAEQFVLLLAARNKPAVIVTTQLIPCVRCKNKFPVSDAEKIVDGPYES
jgi:hypothetical protein